MLQSATEFLDGNFRLAHHNLKLMSLRVLIAPDKFKGTLTARQVAAAISSGWHSARPQDRLELLPISDGGDGFGGVMSELLGACPRTVRTVDAAHRACKATWWWDATTRTAILESACIVGLAMLPKGKFHPFDLDTFGLGAAIQKAVNTGARRVLIGIGGSATNDGGFGLARALGWSFLNRLGERIEHWTDLGQLQALHSPKKRSHVAVVVAVDVQNKLLGPRGATRIYGPQKGIRPEDMGSTERCLRRLAEVVRRTSRKNIAAFPGAGAAGGLGFGLAAFVDARLLPGFDLFARQAGLPRKVRAADLVITGEGTVDDSSLMGKGVGELAQLCQTCHIPCVALAGKTTHSRATHKAFKFVAGLTDSLPLQAAMEAPSIHLACLAAQVASSWPQSPDLRLLSSQVYR